MSEGNVTTVGDLTEEHYGWEVRVAVDAPYHDHVSLAVDRLRRWTYEGEVRVEIFTKAKRGSIWAGEVSVFPADAACELVCQLDQPRRKARTT